MYSAKDSAKDSANPDRPLQVPAPPRGDVEAFLDRIRPGLIADGGNVELVDVDPDGTVRVKMQGECAHCPAQIATLRVAIEEPLCRGLPGIVGVVAV
jgi:Fe-S cluster biogenesis protein NfuA